MTTIIKNFCGKPYEPYTIQICNYIPFFRKSFKGM